MLLKHFYQLSHVIQNSIEDTAAFLRKSLTVQLDVYNGTRYFLPIIFCFKQWSTKEINTLSKLPPATL